jgi:mono/diheme cytochrome c family protein
VISFGFALLTATLLAPTVSAAPVVPGLSNKHPLSEPQVGQLLINELRCAACHTNTNLSPQFERAAPDLAGVGARVATDYLRKFITSPSTAHSGTTMPDLLGAEPADQRDKIAETITHFLVAQARSKFERQPIGKEETAAGKGLFHSIGCVTCHAPRDDDGKEIARDGAVELGHVPAKYNPGSLSDFLAQPTRVRSSGRMPDMTLERLDWSGKMPFIVFFC